VLSLAIGKEVQNVRLAAKPPAGASHQERGEKRREVEAQFRPGVETPRTVRVDGASEDNVVAPPGITEDAAAEAAGSTPLPYTLAGIGEKTVRKHVEAGFTSLERVAEASVEQLSKVPGVGEKTAGKILAAARGDTPSDAGSADV
jgi:hypothetical protein